MISQLLGSILGNQAAGDEGEGNKGLGSLLIVGVVLFVLLGGLKLFKKPEDNPDGSC